MDIRKRRTHHSQHCFQTLTSLRLTRQRIRLNKILDGKDAPAAASQLVDLLRNEAKVIA